jgi:hypothetical protein
LFKEGSMSQPWVRRSGRAGRAVAAVVVLSLIIVSGPAVVARDASQNDPPTGSPLALTTPPLASPPTRAPRPPLDGLARSIEKQASSLAQTTQQTGQLNNPTVQHSPLRCGLGLAILAVGGTVAALSVARHSSNAQAPAPPVWSVVGTGVAAAGGVEAIRQCRH